MPNEDKQFFELLKNEGMEGVLKQYIPIEDMVEKLQEELAHKVVIIKAMAEFMLKNGDYCLTCYDENNGCCFSKEDFPTVDCIIKRFTEEVK